MPSTPRGLTGQGDVARRLRGTVGDHETLRLTPDGGRRNGHPLGL